MVKIVIPTYILGVSKRVEKFAAALIQLHKSTSTDNYKLNRLIITIITELGGIYRRDNNLWLKKSGTTLLTSRCTLKIKQIPKLKN